MVRSRLPKNASRSIFSAYLVGIFAVLLFNSYGSNAYEYPEVRSTNTTCDQLTSCKDCSNAAHCGWCSKSKQCFSIETLSRNSTLCSGFCSGESCECAPCTNTIFPCSDNIVGLIMLMAFYGLILSCSAKVISDGSELLLELFPSWGTVIGALLLPILGAVPDAAIIIVSGALGSAEEAQTQVAVGVGTLAGSTIMLLTVPWFCCMLLGRCDINDVGDTVDGRSTGFSITKQGVNVDDDTPINAKIMLLTSLTYFIIQGVAFAYLYDPTGKAAKNVEHPFALAGFIICTVCLLGYCVYQMFVPQLAQRRLKKIEKELLERKEKLKALHIVHVMKQMNSNPEAPPVEVTEEHKHAKALQMGLKWKKKTADKKEQPVEAEKLIPDSGNIQEPHDEEEEDPRTHFRKNLAKSLIMMAIGTALVAFFSDPMVSAISGFADKLRIKPFYVSFLITPYCSNASEFISSLIFISAKSKENASLTYSQLYGAATMNNTLCLGIFFALIYFRKLAWEFTAETLAILMVTWVVGAIAAFKTKFPVYWCFPIIFLYPFSLFFVWFLEYVAHWT